MFSHIKKKLKTADTTKSSEELDGVDPAIYKRRWWTLATLCLALLGVMLANSSMNMALPSMATDLSLTQLEMTWIVNIYTLIFASLLFTAGAVGDRYGRKLAMQIGLAVFVGGSLYAGFIAQSSAELIIARAVMGIGGALVMPTTLSVINVTFPRKERARAVAIWSGVAGVGMMFGTVVSGFLLEHFSWHSLFFMSAAIAITGLAANHLLVHESRDEHETPVDWLGGVLSAVGLFGLVYGVTEAPAEGLHDIAVATSLSIGAVSLLLFVVWELRAKHPMLDMKLFKRRGFSVSSLVLTLTFLAMSGVFFSLSQLQQLILGMSPLKASLSVIPIMLPMLIVSPFIPNVVKKIGARFTVSAGLLIMTVAFVIMSTWTIDMTYWDLLLTMAIMMVGISAAMTPGTNILMSSVPRNRSGMGSAMNDTTRELGGALGVAVLGAILSSVYEKNIVDTAEKIVGPAKDAIETSLAAALQVADKVGPAGDSIAIAAKEAWMGGLSSAALVAASIIFVASIIALLFLPKRAAAQR